MPYSAAAEVEAVITREINAFFSRDFEAWSACYLQTDRLRTTMMSHDLGLDIREGWDAHREGTRLHFETRSSEAVQWGKEVDQVHVRGDMAWLTCRAYADASLCMMGQSYETWVLERHDGAWKIVCVNVMAVSSYEQSPNRIALDHEGRIIGGDATAQRHLADHPLFMVRTGRLRAVDPEQDRHLQDGIRQAGKLHGYFEQAAYADAEGQRFCYPLVLPHTSGEGHELLMLRVQDRCTYLDFGTSQAVARQVDASALIFGLSEHQHRVAQAIVAGQSLPAIARDMGISVATAKTHLGRIHEKTGTASMIGLVRLMLSTG